MTGIFLKKYMKLIILLITVCTLFAGCTKLDVFEKNISIPHYQWQYNFQPGFDFTIDDTTALYNLFVVLRHTDAYSKNNIWLNIGTQAPGDSSAKYRRFDFSLGNDAGGWEGVGMDDIWEVRKPLVTGGPVKFNKPGLYHFTVSQIMRENPLTGIMSVGVRVEKANTK
jgi:gliding motility-associated lipoprotein GldH